MMCEVLESWQLKIRDLINSNTNITLDELVEWFGSHGGYYPTVPEIKREIAAYKEGAC